MSAGRLLIAAAMVGSGLVLGVGTGAGSAAGAAPVAAAAAEPSQIVGEVPSTASPNILNGMTYDIAKVGNRVIAGGSFTQTAPPGSTAGNGANPYAISFDAGTGAIVTGFSPKLNGTVRAVEAGPTANTVYLGGLFTSVNGAAVKSITLVGTGNGQRVAGFNPPSIVGGNVFTAKRVGNRLYIGGTFTKVGGKPHAGLAVLNATTGALEESAMTLQVAGHHNYTGEAGQDNKPVGVTTLDVTPDGTTMVATGNFTSVSGAPRDQIAMIDLGTTATVDQDWSTQGYTAACFSWAFDSYMKDVEIAPDGSYFVVVATGGSGTNDDGTKSLCDTATRWEIGDTGSNVRPTWINHAGQDTLSGVGIGKGVVYVGGHQRWLNNNDGYDAPGQAAVPRPGLAALNAENGALYSWNPGRHPRGVGAYALEVADNGLYVGSDTAWIGPYQYRRERISYFPFSTGKTIPNPTTADLPSNVFAAGQLPSAVNSNVLYRVNAGGSSVAAIDDGPDWMGDENDAAAGAAYRNTGSNAAGWGSGVTRDATIPDSTPSVIFDSERWDPSGGDEMHWQFPVPSGTDVKLRLYLANRCGCTSQAGQRSFNVAVDGDVKLPNYDIVADVGDQTATMKEFDVTSDGQLDIDLTHVVENPLINGIEIVKDGPPPPPSDTGRMLERPFDGTTVGGVTDVTGGIDWSGVRGAFMVDDTLFYGSIDNTMYSRTYNGTKFGAATKIDPYNDPKWSDVSNGSGGTYRGTVPSLYSQMSAVTGMFFLDGRLYYTRLGDSNLYSRQFEPESGILGDTTKSTPGVPQLGSVAGMFYTDGQIYLADRNTGDLKKLGFDGSTVTGPAATVSGPGTDGTDWRARGLFLYGAHPSANQPPEAAIQASCTGMTCSFDGSGSSDPDGTVASYLWSFGDGTTSTAASPSHTYTTAGDYPVTLIVTDNDGAGSPAAAKTVTVSDPPASSLSFVGASQSALNSGTTASIKVPAGVSSGDRLLLTLTTASGSVEAVPAGWTRLGAQERGAIRSVLFTRAAGASDAGTNVSFTFPTSRKAALNLAAYSPSTVSASAGSTDTTTGTHVTPKVNAPAGAWLVSSWGDKSGGTTAWSLPASVTKRSEAYSTGGGRFTSVLGDSGAGVSAGQQGGLTATSNSTSGKGAMWSIVLVE